MPYKTVCAGLVAGDARTDATISLAVDLAAAHDSHLSGLCVVPPVTLPVYAAVPLPADLIDSYYAENESAAKAAGETFERKCKAAGIGAYDWQMVNGPVMACFEDAAPYADVVVVSQHASGEFGWLVGDASLGLGVPVLAVPEAGTPGAFGRNILLAWTPRRECTRAVRDALPLLRRAERVVVVRVNPDDDHRDADIGAYLARHDVKVEVKDVTTSEVDIGDAILNAVTDESCDMIVMGAYGHSRVREFAFGGVTRHVLEHMTVPTLLSH